MFASLSLFYIIISYHQYVHFGWLYWINSTYSFTLQSSKSLWNYYRGKSAKFILGIQYCQRLIPYWQRIFIFPMNFYVIVCNFTFKNYCKHLQLSYNLLLQINSHYWNCTVFINDFKELLNKDKKDSNLVY